MAYEKKTVLILKELYFLWNRTIFPGTQAFASPPDLASSDVWENIILSKKPTFYGVCGMFFLYNIFLDNCQKVISCQFLLTNGKSTINI